MKTLVKSLLVLGTVVAAGSTSADILDTFNAYIGADIAQTRSKPRNDWAQVFAKDSLGGNLYVGTRFHENFSLELGYTGTRNQKKAWSMNPGNTFFAGVIPASGLSGTTKVKKVGGYLDLNGYLPVTDCTSLLVSVGIGWLQAKVESTLSTAVGASPTSSALGSVSGKGRVLGRLGAGIEYQVTDIVGVRAKINYDSTTTLRFKGNALFNALAYDQKAYKGSTTLSLGVFAKF